VSGPGLTAWLVVSAALFCLGVMAAVLRRDRGGVPAGQLLMLAATTVALAALVRFEVLGAGALSTLLLVLVLGSLFVLLSAALTVREEEP
jgi:hypothetical protein